MIKQGGEGGGACADHRREQAEGSIPGPSPLRGEPHSGRAEPGVHMIKGGGAAGLVWTAAESKPKDPSPGQALWGDPHCGRPFRAPVPDEESERNVALLLLWGSHDRSLSRPGSMLSAAAARQGVGGGPKMHTHQLTPAAAREGSATPGRPGQARGPSVTVVGPDPTRYTRV